MKLDEEEGGRGERDEGEEDLQEWRSSEEEGEKVKSSLHQRVCKSCEDWSKQILCRIYNF